MARPAVVAQHLCREGELAAVGTESHSCRDPSAPDFCKLWVDPNTPLGESPRHWIMQKGTNWMLSGIGNFLCDEDGLEMVEWAIVAALIASAAVPAISSLGTNVVSEFVDIDTLILGLP